MEEADLLKERLQAITDKRRIQENIAMKRRQIEEEKLKLQYIKKKALREHWLMDGLSQQSAEEQEAMRLQAQDEQQQSDQLQSNILRIEKEIEALENEELNISANEEVVLKRLKEVEKTAADIIKELNTDLQAATFAMEFSVEHDNKTGKRQVVSTATITPETIQDRGLKVYDDGHKSVYAMLPDGAKMLNGAVGRMTPAEVEELLNQATDKNVPTEVQYHQPVYSVPYPSGNRPSTPKTPNKSQQQTPPRSLTPFQDTILHRSEVKICKEDDRGNRDLEGWKTQSKTPSPSFIQEDSMSQVQEPGQETKLSYFDIPGQPSSGKHLFSQPCFGAKSPQSLTDSKIDVTNPTPAALVSVKARSEGMPAPKQPVYRAVDDLCLSPARHKSEVDPDALVENSGDMNQHLPFCTERITSLNVINTLPQELSSEPLTMIFMGYENAEDEEEEDIQAELVIINTDDYEDDEGQSVKNESDMEECLSYHPEGYKSKVFQPKVGIAKVTGYRDFADDPCTNWDDLELHKPTFIHKPGEHSP